MPILGDPFIRFMVSFNHRRYNVKFPISLVTAHNWLDPDNSTTSSHDTTSHMTCTTAVLDLNVCRYLHSTDYQKVVCRLVTRVRDWSPNCAGLFLDTGPPADSCVVVWGLTWTRVQRDSFVRDVYAHAQEKRVAQISSEACHSSIPNLLPVR